MAFSFYLFDMSFLGWSPPGLLGVMLIYVGVCHALLVRRLEQGRLIAWSIGLTGLLT